MSVPPARPRTMRAIVFSGPGRISVREIPSPEPGPGEALIDVRLAGICGTDLQLARGYMGFAGVPGHEFVGTVREVASTADRLLTGARVTGEINLGCQDCPLCADGIARHCPRRRVLGILGKEGAFAERLTLPVSNLHVVPDTISDRHAVFIEPVAAAFEILDQVGVHAGQRILVIGDGRLGLIVAQVLASRGAAVTVAGRHESKLAVGRALGLAGVLMDDSPVKERFDIVVEATGSTGGLDQALARVRPRGTVVLKSTCTGATTLDASRIVIDEVTIVGSRCGRFEPAIHALRGGDVVVEPLITGEMPLDAGADAFDRAAQGETIKILLRVAA